MKNSINQLDKHGKKIALYEKYYFSKKSIKI